MGTMLVRVARMVRRSPCQCVRFAHSQALRCRHASAADLISSVPIDLVLSLSVNGCVGSGATSGPDGLGSIGDTARLVRILRLVKLLKILRIIRLQTRFEELSDRAPALNTPLVKLLQPLFSTFYFAHILSCCFFAVGASVYYGAPPGSRAQLSSWLASSSLEMPEAECDATLLNHTSIFEKSDGIVVYDVDDWRDATDEERALMMQDWEIACGRPQLQWAQAGPAYTASLYWTFTTITTVGYGDLIPAPASGHPPPASGPLFGYPPAIPHLSTFKGDHTAKFGAPDLYGARPARQDRATPTSVALRADVGGQGQQLSTPSGGYRLLGPVLRPSRRRRPTSRFHRPQPSLRPRRR